MDFIPAGYITICDAVDRILRATHGADWGAQEIGLESEKVSIPGTRDAVGQSIEGQPYDRMAIATARKQKKKAEGQLLSALSFGELVAEIEDGPPVPKEYWQTYGARTTVITSILELGDGAKPEDVRWQHRRVLFEIEQFDVWLTGAPAAAIKQRSRRHDLGQDALLKNKIKSVLAAAGRRWPDPSRQPGRNQMARLLLEEDAVRKTGYKDHTIRKVLDGSYSASQRLGIPGYPGIDIRPK